MKLNRPTQTWLWVAGVNAVIGTVAFSQAPSIFIGGCALFCWGVLGILGYARVRGGHA